MRAALRHEAQAFPCLDANLTQRACVWKGVDFGYVLLMPMTTLDQSEHSS